MTRASTKAAVGIAFTLTLLFAMGGTVFAQDSVSAARDLYASAAYADALTMLNRLAERPGRAAAEPGVELYRALCFFALGNSTEADHALEGMIAQAPMYQPSDVEIPPRVHARLTDVRRRVLPAIVQQRYVVAKAAFDRKDFASAEMGFSQMLATLADPDVAIAANQPPLADLKTLAIGFRDLSATSTKLATAPVLSLPLPEPVVRVAMALPARAAAPRIHSADEAGVVPPVILNQVLPAFQGQVLTKRTGAVEIVVDETGAVESAVMRLSVAARYDELVLAASRRWRYKPATFAGEPAKYRKVIQIQLTTAP